METRSMDIIKTEHLVYEYEKRDEEGNVIGVSRAIDGVDVDVTPGQFVAVLGHNGSGKSTFAKHLNAILVPTEGTVWVDGKTGKIPEIPENFCLCGRRQAWSFRIRITRSSEPW